MVEPKKGCGRRAGKRPARGARKVPRPPRGARRGSGGRRRSASCLLCGRCETVRTIRRMKGDADIIELLNEALTSELTAINQYFIHAKMLKNQGYGRLAKKKREESIEEMHHA